MKNFLRLISAVTGASALSFAATAADLRQGLISYWPLDTVAADFSSTPDLVSGNNFTLVNIFDASSHIEGKRGKALLFNGTDQYAFHTSDLTVDRGLPATHSPQFTVAFWVKGMGTGQNDRRMFSESSTLNNDPLFNLGTHNAGTDGTVDIFIRDGGTAINHAHGLKTALDDTWHHVAWTDSNGVANLYVDGQLDSSYTYGRRTTQIDTTSIGAILRAAPGAFFAGAMDDVAIWDRALSAEEVQTLVTTGITTPVAPTAPSFSQQPVAPTELWVGKTLTLTASATGSRPISYQWRKNGTPIPDATSAQLIISNVQFSDSGAYTVVAQNAVSSVTSNPVQVTVGAEPGPNLTNDLVAYYPFEEVQGTKTPDKVRGYDMDLINLTAADLVPGKNGNTFQLSNAKQTMIRRVHGTSDLLPVNKHNSFTISFWANVMGPGQTDLRLFSEASTTSTDPLFNLGTDNTSDSGQVDVFIRRSGWTTFDHADTTLEPLDGTWHHIVFVQDAGRRAIYIDGVRDELAIPDKQAGEFPANNTSIGGIFRASPSHWVTGLIDEVALWKRALTVSEINKVRLEGVPSVTAQPLPMEVRSFRADYPVVAKGDTVTLRWDVTKDASVSINQGIGDVTSRTTVGIGSITVPVTQSGAYTLTITRGQQSTNATINIQAVDGLAQGWRVLENFEAYNAGPVLGNGYWKNPEGAGNIRDLGPNNVFGFDGGGGDLTALQLNSQELIEGRRSTLFFRTHIATNDVTPIGVNVGLTERPIRGTGDFAQDVGPYIRFERLQDEEAVWVQARNGVGGVYDLAPVQLTAGKVYNFWIDIQNDTLEAGDKYTVYMAEEGQAARTLMFDQYIADRNPAGSPDLGAAGTNLTHLVVVANAASQSVNAIVFDDFFMSSNNAFASSVPLAAGTFVPVAQPTTIRITSYSAPAGGASFTLSWAAQNGARYNVMKATTLQNPQWTQVGATVTANGATASFTDTNAGGRMGFYRVTVAP